jgi:hypothetical protein
MPFPFTCPHCGKQTVVPEQYYGQSGPCGGCGQIITALPPGVAAPPFVPPPRPIGDDAGMRLLLPVGRSGWAIAAGYLGLISVLLLPAPLAVLCGILAIRDIKKHPDRHGMGRAIFGLVLGGLGTILLVAMLVGLMIAGIKGR